MKDITENSKGTAATDRPAYNGIPESRMRRKDREVTDSEECFGILCRCGTVSIGFSGREFPYVVPVSFGARREGGLVAVYFHGAGQGFKDELIRLSPRVCIEGHIFFGTEKTHAGITARYESVIGFGCAERAEGDEAADGLRLIMEHYGYEEPDPRRCPSFPQTAVYKVMLEAITGKRNLPD